MHIPQGVPSKSFDSEEDSIDLKGIFNKLIDKWHWFIFSVFICLLAAFLYARYTAPVYQIKARLLVSDDEKGGGLGKQASALMDLGGIMGAKNSVENEAEILKTRFLMEQVVRQMNLNIVYAKKSGLIIRELYSSPFKINIIKGIDTIKTTSIEVQKSRHNKLKVTGEGFEVEVDWNEVFNINGIGNIQITSMPTSEMTEDKYYVRIYSNDTRVATLMSQLTVAPSNKQVSIIDLGLTYSLPNKGEDILRTLIQIYITSNLNDKNTIADSTYTFIKERLNVIASELGDVENNLQNFKEVNKLSDMTEQGKLLVQNSTELNTELAKAETQVSILAELENYLKDETKNKRVFPSSLLPSDMVFSNLMSQYNSLLVERDKQLLGLTEESPFIKNLDDQIVGLRRGILANVQSTKNSFVLNRNKLIKQLNQAQGQIGNVPQIEKNYIKLARNKDIKQELYIFLMQKAEETAISKTSNISGAKVIDPPKSEVGPISPKKSAIYFAGLALGLTIPVIIIFALILFNSSVSTKEDIINHTQVPIVGEISHNLSSDNLVVANQSRSAISEQFRALRTNLSFYLKNADEKVILLTSSMSGEGKSFTAINLGNILALTGKKVLLMELDLRKPGLSAKLGVNNDVGFSNYTISPEIKVKDIIKSLEINQNMFIVSSGPLPPNPAETIMSENTATLIDELKSQFDYIIMDAPPVGVITDAQLLSEYADVTLYLVRQKVTQKGQLSIVEELYQSGKMKNLGIVVNDIASKYYGYGYGYGNYGENSSGSFLKKMLNKIGLG
jgi:tyrosine-protein kinase Etk/Wzc